MDEFFFSGKKIIYSAVAKCYTFAVQYFFLLGSNLPTLFSFSFTICNTEIIASLQVSFFFFFFLKNRLESLI